MEEYPIATNGIYVTDLVVRGGGGTVTFSDNVTVEYVFTFKNGIVDVTLVGSRATKLYKSIFGRAARDLINWVIGSRVVNLVDQPVIALDAFAGNVFNISTMGDRLIKVPSNPTPGKKFIIRHRALVANRLLSLDTGLGGFRFGSDITGLTTTIAGKTDLIGCIYDEIGLYWAVASVVKGY